MSIWESRLLEFDGDAIRDAVMRCGRQATALGLCGTDVSAVDFVPEKGVVVIRLRGDGREHAYNFSAAQMVALLISYCMLAGIPLPRQAEKKSSIAQDRLIIGFCRHYPTARDGVAAVGAPSTSSLAAQGRAVSWR